MKIEFLWKERDSNKYPYCSSSLTDNSGVDLIACVLMDDGGCGYHDSISWLSEGIDNIRNIKNKKIHTYDWDRESWGVKLSADTAIIYSLYDEDCTFALSIDDFETILCAWKDFICDTSSTNIQVDFGKN
jgi:hypothetical protein